MVLYIWNSEREPSNVYHMTSSQGFCLYFLGFHPSLFPSCTGEAETQKLTRSRSHISERRSWERELVALIPSLSGLPMWRWLLNPNSPWTGSWHCRVNTLTPKGDMHCDRTCFNQSSALSLPRKKMHVEMQRKPRKLLTGYKYRSKETRYPSMIPLLVLLAVAVLLQLKVEVSLLRQPLLTHPWSRPENLYPNFSLWPFSHLWFILPCPATAETCHNSWLVWHRVHLGCLPLTGTWGASLPLSRQQLGGIVSRKRWAL